MNVRMHVGVSWAQTPMLRALAGITVHMSAATSQSTVMKTTIEKTSTLMVEFCGAKNDDQQKH